MIFEIVYSEGYTSNVTYRAFIEAPSIDRVVAIFNNRYVGYVLRSVVFRALTMEGYTELGRS